MELLTALTKKMRKYSIIIALLLTACSVQAQRKYVIKDTTETVMPAPEVMEDEDGPKVVEAVPADEDSYSDDDDYGIKKETVDTTLYFKGLPLNSDSITNLRKEKGFGYSSYLDSLLRAQQEAEKKKKEKEPEKEKTYTNANSGVETSSFLSSPILRVISCAVQQKIRKR
jgi:hypothetical protein